MTNPRPTAPLFDLEDDAEGGPPDGPLGTILSPLFLPPAGVTTRSRLRSFSRTADIDAAEVPLPRSPWM